MAGSNSILRLNGSLKNPRETFCVKRFLARLNCKKPFTPTPEGLHLLTY